MTGMEERVAILETKVEALDTRISNVYKGVRENSEVLQYLKNREEFKTEQYERRAAKRARLLRYTVGLGGLIGGAGTWLSEHWHRFFK